MNKQESMAIHMKKSMTETNPEAQNMKLVVKDVKSSVLNMLKELKKTKTNK